jgi:hypothetical protein
MTNQRHLDPNSSAGGRENCEVQAVILIIFPRVTSCAHSRLNRIWADASK